MLELLECQVFYTLEKNFRLFFCFIYFREENHCILGYIVKLIKQKLGENSVFGPNKPAKNKALNYN